MKRIITELKQQARNKKRYNVYTDEGFLLSLSCETVLRYGLAPGRELEEDFLALLRQEDTVKYAKEAAMSYVGYAQRTRRQVETHLAKKGIDAQSIAAAVEALMRYHYIDDAAYVREFALSYRDKLGRYAMRQKLLQRGVPAEVIEENLDVPEETQAQAAAAIAARLAARYSGLPEQKSRQKIYAALYRKGFDSDMILRVLGEGEETGQ